VMPFWAALPGYDTIDDEDLVDRQAQGPSTWIQRMDAPRPQPHPRRRLPAARTRRRSHRRCPGRRRPHRQRHPCPPVVDPRRPPEGHEADVATWLGRN
jgi:4a-hydroxytetrahydrobiopterin dehydratase